MLSLHLNDPAGREFDPMELDREACNFHVEAVNMLDDATLLREWKRAAAVPNPPARHIAYIEAFECVAEYPGWPLSMWPTNVWHGA